MFVKVEDEFMGGVDEISFVFLVFRDFLFVFIDMFIISNRDLIVLR